MTAKARTGGSDVEHTQACAGVIGYDKATAATQRIAGILVVPTVVCGVESRERRVSCMLRSQLRCPRCMLVERQRWPNRPLNMWQHNGGEK